MDSLDNKVGLVMVFLSWMPSPLKKSIYRLLGAKIGKHVSLGIGSVIVARSFKNVSIGDYSTVDSFCMIICDHIKLGEDAHIGPFVWVYGGSMLWMIPRECTFSMGSVTYIGARSVINVTEDVSIGDYTGIGAGVTIYTHGFQASYIDGEPRKEAPVKIGKHVWVQPKSIVLPGVTIGDGSIIASGSVVTKDIPANIFATGCPCAPKSDVSLLKKGNSIDEREERTLKVIADYFASLKFFKKDKMEIKEAEKNCWELSLKRYFGLGSKKYLICYLRKTDEAAVEKISRSKERIILISLQEIAENLEKVLNKNDILWIDLQRKQIIHKEGLPPMFYPFLKDYYGVGLLCSEGK